MAAELTKRKIATPRSAAPRICRSFDLRQRRQLHITYRLLSQIDAPVQSGGDRANVGGSDEDRTLHATRFGRKYPITLLVSEWRRPFQKILSCGDVRRGDGPLHGCYV
jgi:hypothetical protein